MKNKKRNFRIFNIKNQECEDGFSFIELLIVIVIIATLSGIIGFAYTKWINSSRRSATLASLESIKKAVATYHLENGSFPSNLNQIKDRLAGNAKLQDAWGTQFKMTRIQKDNKTFIKIFSVGSDKKPNTDDDIPVLIRAEGESAPAGGSSGESSGSGGYDTEE